MEFCATCHNMTYLLTRAGADGGRPELAQNCVACNTVVPLQGARTVRRLCGEDTSAAALRLAQLGRNPHLKHDAALPRHADVARRCACGGSGTCLVIKYDLINARYAYACETCGAVWPSASAAQE